MRPQIRIHHIPNISIEDAVASLIGEKGFVCIDRRNALSPENRFSVVAALPKHTFSLAGAFVTIDGHTVIDTPADAFTGFLKLASSIPFDPYVRFSGGAIGYIGFEGAKVLRGFKPAKGFSRLPQCLFGIYDSVILFDHVEGRAFAVSDKAGEEKSLHMMKLMEAGKNFAPEAEAKASDNTRRMTPDDATFNKLVKEAEGWLRAECVENIRLVRHEEKSQPKVTPSDFFNCKPTGGIRAMFVYEGSAMVMGSNLRIRSSSQPGRSPFHLDERAYRNLIRGLISDIPEPSLVGSPCHKAMLYIDENEKEHRQFYGGAFGLVHAGGIEFHAIDDSTSFADGTAKRTIGYDVGATHQTI